MTRTAPQAGFCSPFACEEGILRKRRKRAGKGSGPEGEALIPFGLALSGGGIRSATFGLGVLQGLAALKLLKRVDYLSTVSGGGYIGSYLGGLFQPRGTAAEKSAFTADSIQDGLQPDADPAHPVARTLRWLRENGRYLTPGGSGDAFLAMGTVIRNWVAVMVVMLLFVLTVWMTLDLPLRLYVGEKGWTFSAHFIRGVALRISPWFWLLPIPLIGAVGAGWAYFLVGYEREPSDTFLTLPSRRPAALAVVVLAGSIAGLVWAAGLAPTPRWPTWILRTLAILALGSTVGLTNAWLSHRYSGTCPGRRRALARILRGWLLAAAVLAAIAVVDSLGWTLAFPLLQATGATEDPHKLGPLARLGTFAQALFLGEKGQNAQAAAALGALTWMLGGLVKPGKSAPQPTLLQRIVGGFLLPLTASLLSLLVLGLVAALAHGLWFQAKAGSTTSALAVAPGVGRWGLYLGILATCLLAGRIFGFLNQSTLGPFYTAALTRAYLGASAATRWKGRNASPDRLPEDDLAREQYHPWDRGGPIHIINATLNETTGGRSQMVQRDRKGMNVAVGGAGISVGVRHHAHWWFRGRLKPLPLSPGEHGVFDRVLTPKRLTVGQWVGISGAAFSTGLGNRTSLSTSLLAGLFNIRLGHWWDWGGRPRVGSDWMRRAWEATFPVHARLFEEWVALFPGTASSLWYLTDGGHFENTAVYELVRRRLPLILLSDNGEDQEAHMEDLANLVAKARVDFQTEITFLDEAGLTRLVGTGANRRCFGTLDQMLDPAHTAIAAAARLQYPDREGTLIVLKPTLAPDLPMDLRDYARTHPTFPQESTVDQFFDERQWESYRKLGEVIALSALGIPSPQPGEERRRIPAPWVRAILDPAPTQS